MPASHRPAAAASTTTATAATTTAFQLDDLNLQYRMQQIGVILFLIPTIVLDGPRILYHWYNYVSVMSYSSSNGSASGAATAAVTDMVYVILKYALLSIGNGLAFATYK